MVDITDISTMREINIFEDYVYLGAAVTHDEIINNPHLNQHALCVVEGCGMIGGPQVRNIATIGGNVAHALPAGDGTIALLALDTEVEIASVDERRWVPLEQLFLGPGKPSFDRKSELVVRFRFLPAKVNEASVFYRVMRPQGVAIAILNIAAWIRCADDGSVEDVRIAMGPAGPRPFRAHDTEAALKGKFLTDEVLKAACDVMADEVNFRTSAHRATKEYRHQLLPVLLERALRTAYERCSG
jgi:carbon-monoxide dehydrogenase medium subunit